MTEKLILWLKSEAQQRDAFEKLRVRFHGIRFKRQIQVKSEEKLKN